MDTAITVLLCIMSAIFGALFVIAYTPDGRPVAEQLADMIKGESAPDNAETRARRTGV